MIVVRPGTFSLTLPNGEEVLCWTRDRLAILHDVGTTGDVFLVRDPLTGVYQRAAPEHIKPAQARVVE